MSEAPENITNQPPECARKTGVTKQPPCANPSNANLFWDYLLVWTLGVCVVVLAVGLFILFVEKAQAAATRNQSANNLRQMCLAVNNMSSTSMMGYIPPSYGYFPPSNIAGGQNSFFVWLLPYIEVNYAQTAANSNVPVKTYIAKRDPFNPGTSALISYGSNATLLMVGGSPTLPNSFAGRRPANVIVVYERTAESGATWHDARSYLSDTNGSSSPEFGEPASWSNYGSRATALSSDGCLVGMGDGSARLVTPSNANAGWVWSMDPRVGTTAVPNGW
jgi:hypothetical protein